MKAGIGSHKLPQGLSGPHHRVEERAITGKQRRKLGSIKTAKRRSYENQRSCLFRAQGRYLPLQVCKVFGKKPAGRIPQRMGIGKNAPQQTKSIAGRAGVETMYIGDHTDPFINFDTKTAAGQVARCHESNCRKNVAGRKFFLGVVGRDAGVPDNATLCMTGTVAGEEVFFNGNQNIS